MVPDSMKIGRFVSKIDGNIIASTVPLVSQMHRLVHIGHQVYQKLEGFLPCFSGRLGINQNTFVLFDFFGHTALPGAIPLLMVPAVIDSDIGVMQNIRLVVASLDFIGPVGDICQMIYVKIPPNGFLNLGVQIHFRNMTHNTMTRRTPGQPFL